MNSSVWCQKPAANWVFVSCCWQSPRGVCVLYLLFWQVFAPLTTSGRCVSVFQWCVLLSWSNWLYIKSNRISCFLFFMVDSVQYMISHASPADLAISQQASTSPCWNKQRRPAPKHSICWTCWFFQLGWKVLSVGWVLECGLMMWTGPGNWRKQLTAKNVHLNKSFL